MTRILALVALVLAALVGCGGDDSAAVGTDSAATIAPASAPMFASIDSDLSSDQWQQLDELLQRFPGRDRLVDELRSSLAGEGVSADEIDEAFGPTVDVVVLDLEDEGAGVFLTKTEDVEALKALLAKGDDEWVTEQLDDGWVGFSDEQSSIDALKAGSGKAALADDEQFDDAMAKLPDQALAKLYVDGEAVAGELGRLGGGASIPQVNGKLIAAAAAVVAEDSGVRLKVYAKGDGSTEAPDVGELLEDVPDGVIAFANFGLGGTADEVEKALESQPGAKESLDMAEAMLGLSLDDLTSLFRDEAVLYVRPGVLIPEVTLVVKTDGAEGKRTVDRLLEAATKLTGGETRSTEVDGLPGTEVSLGPVSIYVVADGDRVIVSTLERGIADYRSDGDKLADDGRYEDALDASGVGGDEDVYLYVDIDETYGLVERLLQLADEPVPSEVDENVEPLRAVVVSGKVDGDETESSIFLSLD
jgi:hypothetical protein